MPPIDDDVPDLDDPAHNATRGQLVRLIVLHKADLGVAHFSDSEIVAKVDDIAALMLARHGRALLAGDSAWLAHFAWFADACDRLQCGQRAVPMNG